MKKNECNLSKLRLELDRMEKEDSFENVEILCEKMENQKVVDNSQDVPNTSIEHSLREQLPLYQKKFDLEIEKYYYVDLLSGESTWECPATGILIST